MVGHHKSLGQALSIRRRLPPEDCHSLCRGRTFSPTACQPWHCPLVSANEVHSLILSASPRFGRELACAGSSDSGGPTFDPARCLRESPFKTTLAHGYLTLSLISQFSYASIGIKQKFAMTINYGCNRVRFISPVLCGAKLRARYQLLEVTQFEGGYQSRWQVTIEMEGNTKPACVAETISRYYNEGPK